MRLVVIMIIALLAFAKANSQQTTATTTETVMLDKHPAIVVVDDFFKAFHLQDTTAMRTKFIAEPSVLSIANRANKQLIVYSSIENLLDGIAAIPETVDFEERLTSNEIISDDGIATVHTDYEFYINGDLSHSGRNSFTLVLFDDKWVISQIMDTRIY
ncbi:nuclear transport factor 2 family protein [Nonlabens ponticola]|uniref:Nuclear transport factor 2 family protein n=1 Tax=Nonlabens ponticola TaxID=2496866 RepID=A0A3S9MZQ2_9FLAO|nr:nuclear transport factor 2 family protein [Nonlabens ponticola]AZQ44543.1 nuclear transport factor 2 family protein [Nonlabens ponticola]